MLCDMKTARILFAGFALMLAVTAAPCGTVHAAAPSMCILMISDGAGETVINRCRQCLEITLERSRAGNGTPSVRAFTLPGNSSQPLPFRGPGRTRLIGEDICHAASKNAI